MASLLVSVSFELNADKSCADRLTLSAASIATRPEGKARPT